MAALSALAPKAVSEIPSDTHRTVIFFPPLSEFFSCQRGKNKKLLWKQLPLLVLWVKIEAAAVQGLAVAFRRDPCELPAGAAQGTVAAEQPGAGPGWELLGEGQEVKEKPTERG